ncbi:MAG: motif domain protein [Actinomycetota bacterium]|jgi:SEC-C motif-containing protein|nr:motif domain protein [Actinomycetota bacterium]
MTSQFAAALMCPCGSSASYPTCCEPLHDGEPAATAEGLMRSRYCAFATGRLDYVFRTWHPRTRPADLAPVPDVTWLGLEVLRTIDGGVCDDTGVVEFRARFESAGQKQTMHEISRFERRAGRWMYVDGAAPSQAT